MKILKHQHWHFLSLLILLVGVCLCVRADGMLLHGELWGISTRTWFLLAILSPIIHQLYVVVCWRAELFYQSISSTFGANRGFSVFKLGFGVLIFSRLLTITLLAVSNADSFSANSAVVYIVAGVFFVLSVFLFYSVKKYFGMDRAFGLDHFRPEAMKDEPFVRKGIFKYTSNGMYVFGFLILWVPGLLFYAKAALLVALFNHIYIWVHYYFTELPDMKWIYTNDEKL